MDKQIIPAILAQELDDLKDKLASVDGATEWVHVDIMDGEFVDNYTIDVSDLLSVKHASKVSAHLMVKDPERYFQKCKDAGVARVIFHYESTDRHSDLLQKISELGMKKGIALSPNTPIDVVRDYLHRLDVILLLSVEPGYGGQAFIETTLDKIKDLRKISPVVAIGVDGGIKEENIKEINDAGATLFMINSALFFYKDVKAAVASFKRKIK